MTDFDRFWEKFPRRVGKLAAMKAFIKALKVATPEEIMAGIETYIANKPEYADYCHPSTWLNQGRWMDEPDRRQSERRTEERRQAWGFECPHTPLCRSHWDCVQKRKAG